MRSFQSVHQALYWFFNESDTGFAPSVTGGIIEAIKSGAVKPLKSPWRIYKAVKAGYVCDHCKRKVEKGEPGVHYRLSRSKKAGSSIHKRYCEACGEMMLDLSRKHVRGTGERFSASDQLADATIGRIDMKNLVGLMSKLDQRILYEVSQATIWDMANVYKCINSSRGTLGRQSKSTHKRYIHDLLAFFEGVLREHDYIDGPGEYGLDYVPRQKVVTVTAPNPGYVDRPARGRDKVRRGLDERKADIMKMLDRGFTLTQVADELGASPHSIASWVAKHDEWLKDHRPSSTKATRKRFYADLARDAELLEFVADRASYGLRELREKYPNVTFDEVYNGMLFAAAEALPRYEEGRAKRETYLRGAFKHVVTDFERYYSAA